jgi:hypothetical protein
MFHTTQQLQSLYTFKYFSYPKGASNLDRTSPLLSYLVIGGLDYRAKKCFFVFWKPNQDTHVK